MLEEAINLPCIQKDSITDLQRQMNPESRTMLPKMAFTGFASRYREPTADEGFDDITKVNFKFDGTEAQKTQWRKFWVS